eukprot:Gb_13810 [translate_table: standard]
MAVPISCFASASAKRTTISNGGAKRVIKINDGRSKVSHFGLPLRVLGGCGIRSRQYAPLSSGSRMHLSANIPPKFSSLGALSNSRLIWHAPSQEQSKYNIRTDVLVVLIGWLGSEQRQLKKYAECYGFVLERLLTHHRHLALRIKGTIIDSSPVAKSDAKVWARGFTNAMLGKHSQAFGAQFVRAILERPLSAFLHLHRVRKRLNGAIELLTSGQPAYPQLYMYSSGDQVLPAEWVEEFIEKQRTQHGKKVRWCDFHSSPHVDLLRTRPQLYTQLLSAFLTDCLHDPSVATAAPSSG